MRAVDLDVVAGHAVALQQRAQLVFEIRVDRRTAAAIDGHENGVPAAGPAEGGGGPLHVRMALRDRGVVGRGDRPLLDAEGRRRPLPHVVQ